MSTMLGSKARSYPVSLGPEPTVITESSCTARNSQPLTESGYGGQRKVYFQQQVNFWAMFTHVGQKVVGNYLHVIRKIQYLHGETI